MDNGGPAFPGTHQYFPDDVNYDEFHGMTLRDWFAGQALTGMMASRSPTSPRFHPDDDAQYVCAVADAMLKAREEKP